MWQLKHRDRCCCRASQRGSSEGSLKLCLSWSAATACNTGSSLGMPLVQVPPQLERVSMKIVRAPAAFARPLVQRKLFRPPFKVRHRIAQKCSGLSHLACYRVTAFSH